MQAGSRLWKIALLIAALTAGGACLAATDRVQSAPSLPVRSLLHTSFAVADFDGDSRPDIAITKMEARGVGYVYWLELDLSTNRAADSPIAQAGFPEMGSSIFGLHLTARDVDGDHDLDIVITLGMARRPVAVWINDGKGRFEEGDLAAYPGLTSLEESSFSTQNRLGTTNILYDQSRRSWFGLLAAGLRSRAAVCPRLNSVRRPALHISRFLAAQLPSRAPRSIL